MRRTAVQIMLGVLLLWITSIVASILTERPVKIQITEPESITTESTEPSEYKINVLIDGVKETMSLSEYLTGVLISEMPGEFHIEAKKAQAVAARTFTLRMAQSTYRHGECAVCDDPGCCQGYLTLQKYYSYGGTEDNVILAKQAVEETADTVLTYNGGLIEATYFSCSGGRTEDAVAVWGSEVPYLQAVDSPGEEEAAVYTDSVRFSSSEFQSALGITLNGSPASWFGSVAYTDGNGVATMEIGGIEYTGNDLRFMLNLRSTRFSVTALSDAVIITTWGYGHRVGLSQYGADAMARRGFGWQEILTHYYQGVQLEEYAERTD